MKKEFNKFFFRFNALFHRRSPSCVRSPSPPRSPTWERRLGRLNVGEPSDLDRNSPDWVHDNSGRGSSMSRGRSDSFGKIFGTLVVLINFLFFAVFLVLVF